MRRAFYQKRLRGFSLIEMLVVIGIISILSTIVIYNFQTERIRQEMNVGVNDLISQFREVQSNILSGREVPVAGQPADSYRLRFRQSWNYYLVYYCIDGSCQQLGDRVNYPANLNINRLYIDNSQSSEIYVEFSSPYGEIRVSTNTNFTNGANKKARIRFVHRNNSITETVLIDGVSGRVGLE